MIERTVIVQMKDGLHARPANHFVKKSISFQSEVWVENKGKRVSGKSAIALLTLGAAHGEEVKLTVSGEDEAEACGELAKILEGNA